MENRAMRDESCLVPPAYEDVLKNEENLQKTKPLKMSSGLPESDGRGMVVYVTVDPVSYPDDEQLVSDTRGQCASNEEVAVTGTGVDWLGTSFNDKSIRYSFIRKVFLILMCQLAITVGVISLFMLCKPINRWILNPANFWFYYTSYGVFLVTYIVLACCKNVRRVWPGNLVCLIVFTLSLSCMAGTISSFHNTHIVMVAFGMTAAICLALSLFAIQTKIDFTMFSGLLFAFSMVIFFFGFYCILTAVILGLKSQIMTGVWGGLIALIFSLFLVFDIQQVVGGNSVELSPEEYIYGALHIYLDVIFLFLMILSCSGRSSG